MTSVGTRVAGSYANSGLRSKEPYLTRNARSPEAKEWLVTVLVDGNRSETNFRDSAVSVTEEAVRFLMPQQSPN